MGNNVAAIIQRVTEEQRQREVIYRPQPEPVRRVACSVRSAGWYLVHNPWTETPRVKDFWQIFWTIRGTGRFTLSNSESVDLGPGEYFWYYPDEEHWHETVTEDWEYCWLTLDGPATGSLLETLEMPRTGAGRPCPQTLFRQLIHQMQDNTPDGQRACSVTAYRILLEATAAAGSSATGTREPLAERVRDRIDRDFTDTSFSIEALADELQVHRSTLYRVFRREYGVSPSNYLQDRRVQRGLSLLRESNLPVGIVGYGAGFVDPNYFSKTIRRVTGQSPADFRQG